MLHRVTNMNQHATSDIDGGGKLESRILWKYRGGNVMNSTITETGSLTDAERALIIELLERERSELPGEIHHTQNSDYRDSLHRRLELVQSLLLRIIG
jgi:hypothetical protein